MPTCGENVVLALLSDGGSQIEDVATRVDVGVVLTSKRIREHAGELILIDATLGHITTLARGEPPTVQVIPLQLLGRRVPLAEVGLEKSVDHPALRAPLSSHLKGDVE